MYIYRYMYTNLCIVSCLIESVYCLIYVYKCILSHVSLICIRIPGTATGDTNVYCLMSHWICVWSHVSLNSWVTYVTKWYLCIYIDIFTYINVFIYICRTTHWIREWNTSRSDMWYTRMYMYMHVYIYIYEHIYTYLCIV